jgi:hypothetical protein
MSECEIIRYRISTEPFGEQKPCIKCLTHGWEGFVGQMGMNEDATVCPTGRTLAEDERTATQRLKAVTEFVEEQRATEVPFELHMAALAQVVGDLRIQQRDLTVRINALAEALEKLTYRGKS